jgi:hypothetical protein
MCMGFEENKAYATGQPPLTYNFLFLNNHNHTYMGHSVIVFIYWQYWFKLRASALYNLTHTLALFCFTYFFR